MHGFATTTRGPERLETSPEIPSLKSEKKTVDELKSLSHAMHSADVQSYHINQANHGGIYHMILNPKAACHAINACELLPLAQASTNLTWDRELFQKHPG